MYTEHLPRQTNHILGHRTNLNKFKMIRIIWNMFFDDNGIELEIKNRKVSGKSDTWRLNNINNPRIKEKNPYREIRKYFEMK